MIKWHLYTIAICLAMCCTSYILICAKSPVVWFFVLCCIWSFIIFCSITLFFAVLVITYFALDRYQKGKKKCKKTKHAGGIWEKSHGPGTKYTLIKTWRILIRKDGNTKIGEVKKERGRYLIFGHIRSYSKEKLVTVKIDRRELQKILYIQVLWERNIKTQ